MQVSGSMQTLHGDVLIPARALRASACSCHISGDPSL